MTSLINTLLSYCWELKKNMFMTALCRDTTVSPREDKKPNAVLDESGTKWGLINSTTCFTFSLSSVMYLYIYNISIFKSHSHKHTNISLEHLQLGLWHTFAMATF